jgi:NAD(P)-dependent dehydrogenase (short-subunit alcohol dehydrogenase family)
VLLLPLGLDAPSRAALVESLRTLAREAAPRRVRVNAIEADGVPEADLERTVALLARLPSMTGQVVRLRPP